MKSPNDSPPLSGSSDDYAAEQTFQHWATRRLELYQETEQQVRTGVAHILNLASEFTMQMERETERLLARYQQTRDQQRSEIERLRREAQEQRAALDQEQREHQERLRQEWAEHTNALAQEREQALQTIAQQMAEARAQRERLLAEAYAERDRVLEETRQLSSRLSVLQQSLQGLLGSVAPTPPAPSAQSIPAPVPAPAAVRRLPSQHRSRRPHRRLSRNRSPHHHRPNPLRSSWPLPCRLHRRSQFLRRLTQRQWIQGRRQRLDKRPSKSRPLAVLIRHRSLWIVWSSIHALNPPSLSPMNRGHWCWL